MQDADERGRCAMLLKFRVIIPEKEWRSAAVQRDECICCPFREDRSPLPGNEEADRLDMSLRSTPI